MQFQITKIQFDCSLNSDDGTKWNQRREEEKLREDYVGTFWEADNEEDLIEEITCASGWCIKSIDYHHISN
jgi:hypothetical protein